MLQARFAVPSAFDASGRAGSERLPSRRAQARARVRACGRVRIYPRVALLAWASAPELQRGHGPQRRRCRNSGLVPGGILSLAFDPSAPFGQDPVDPTTEFHRRSFVASHVDACQQGLEGSRVVGSVATLSRSADSSVGCTHTSEAPAHPSLPVSTAKAVSPLGGESAVANGRYGIAQDLETPDARLAVPPGGSRPWREPSRRANARPHKPSLSPFPPA